MKFSLLCVVFLSFLYTALWSSEYKNPPEHIRKVFDAPSAPYIYTVSYATFGFEMTYRRMAKLQTLAEPQLALAGTLIAPRLNASIEQMPYTSLTIRHYETDLTVPVVFNPETLIRSVSVSPNREKAIITTEETDGLYLWILDIATGKTKRIPGIRLNASLNDNILWMNNGKHILVRTIPDTRTDPPHAPLVPESPVIEETKGKVNRQRMTTNLLKNIHDEKLFDYYFTSQAVIIDLTTISIKKIGTPAIYSSMIPSPDNNYFLVTRIIRPYSYQFGYWNFPRVTELWDKNGTVVRTLISRGLTGDTLPGGAYIGPRSFEWQALQDATLVWAEALDNGDPKTKVTHRDKIMMLTAPFKNKPKELTRTVARYSGLSWSENGKEALLYEYNADTRFYTTDRVLLPSFKRLPLFRLSTRDSYNAPGDIIDYRTLRGELVYRQTGNTIYFNNTTGATPEGNKPYLASINLETKEKTILFRSRKDRHETVNAIYKKDFSKIIIRTESPAEPRNYRIVSLPDMQEKELTSFTNPYPELTGLKKEMVTYTRKDGVKLSGTLYLPANYNGERLPLVISAYPTEYTDTDTAGQVSSSPNRFITFWGSSLIYCVLHGYAVLDDASIPIVGDVETVNNTFIEQTIESVDAAIKYLDSRGIIDPKRVGITGHSYGAYMTATVLAHSDICAAGIARSGAYNRTLTPFGFQSERRSLWQAKDFYIKASPFMFAEKINEPLLLIHGENDPNPGTYPIQSERMFQALQVNGATARLVILPFEEHGYYAEESNLHVLAEMLEWFDAYVKNKK